MQSQHERYNNSNNNNNNNNRSGNQNTGFNRRVRTKYDTGNNFQRRQNYNNRKPHRNVTFDNSNNTRQRNIKDKFRYNNQNNRRNNLEDADETQWFKVTIPCGIKSGKASIMASLNSLCDKSFTPFNYQEEGKSIIFYVIGKDVSDTLRSCSRRIKSPNGFLYTILVCRSSMPHTDINPELIGFLKEVMSRRYDTTQRVLNLANFKSDPSLQEQGLFIAISRPKMLMSIIRIIIENIPDIVHLNLSSNRISNLEPLMPLVQSCKLLKHIDLSNNSIANAIPFDYLKGLDLEEIQLGGNPVVTTFKSHEDYISRIRSIFPKLSKLDDEVLPPQIKFDVDEAATLPAIQGSYLPEDTKQFILGFINQYYSIYDSDNRKPLVEAYHEQASFSLSISLQSSNKQKVYPHFPFSMFKESRNLLRVKDRTVQTQLLKRGKQDIIELLSEFPATKHESESFLIDVYVCNPGLINVVINGVYREADEKRDRDREKRSALRSFCRNFLIIPNLIINDLLIVSNATVEQIQKYGKDSQTQLFDKPSTPLLASPQSSSSIATSSLTAVGGDSINFKDSLIRQFSQATGMNTSFSANCLQEFDFDYNNAIDAFQKLNAQGSIPAEAFQW